MDTILIILKKENGPRASSALTLGLNTIILKHVYWYTYMQQISGERLQDHWSSGLTILTEQCLFNHSNMLIQPSCQVSYNLSDMMRNLHPYLINLGIY